MLIKALIFSVLCAVSLGLSSNPTNEEISEHFKSFKEVNNGVPADVTCNVTQWCVDGICSNICKRGTVQVDPWMHYAMKAQNQLARTRPFCRSVIMGTHNSAITMADGYGNEDLYIQNIVDIFFKNSPVHTNDQFLSLTDQLRMGVRMIELDTHWVADELRIAHCGGVHMNGIDKFIEFLDSAAKFLHINISFWDTETVGCSPSLSSIPVKVQRTLADAFEELAAFIALPEYKQEFFIFFFDDQMDLLEWGKVPLMTSLIAQYFPDIVFTTDDYAAYGGFPTMDEMVAKGKRMLFMSGADFGAAMQPLVFAKYGPQLCNWTEPDNDAFVFDFPSCQVKINGQVVPTNNGQLLRPQTSEIVYGPFGGDTLILNETSMPPMVQCNVNMISSDDLTPSRVASQIWSWAENQPLAAYSTVTDMCTSIAMSNGRWYQLACATELIPACKTVGSDDEGWKLGSSAVTFSAAMGGAGCPSGTLFQAPSSPFENEYIRRLMLAQNTENVWINFELDL